MKYTSPKMVAMHWGSWGCWCNLVVLGDVEGGYSGHSYWSWHYRSFMGCQSLCHLSVKEIHTLRGCRNLRTMPAPGLCWPAAQAWSQLISSTFFSVIDPVYFWFSQLSASSLCIKASLLSPKPAPCMEADGHYVWKEISGPVLLLWGNSQWNQLWTLFIIDL